MGVRNFNDNSDVIGCLFFILLIVIFFLIPSADNSVPQDVSDYETFRGYECTDDCSGHEAGYEWAEDKGICDPDSCGGNSQSFIEGCEAYAIECSEGW